MKNVYGVRATRILFDSVMAGDIMVVWRVRQFIGVDVEEGEVVVVVDVRLDVVGEQRRRDSVEASDCASDSDCRSCEARKTGMARIEERVSERWWRIVGVSGTDRKSALWT